jgi:hypothetical protein
MALGVNDQSEYEAKTRARSAISKLARQGRPPSRNWDAEDLAWAYDTAEAQEQLAQLEAEALAIQKGEAERNRQAAARRVLARETERVLAEWDAKEKAERRALAEAEAKKRIDARTA